MSLFVFFAGTMLARGRRLRKSMTIQMPVAMPPGRLRAATEPNFTASLPMLTTIGIVVVAAWAASAAGVKTVAMTVTCPQTSSAARAGIRL
jgi:hypothetical protein